MLFTSVTGSCVSGAWEETSSCTGLCYTEWTDKTR